MTTVLIDTNVLSELARPKPNLRVAGFLEVQDDAIISVITLQELTYGAERASTPARRAKLVAWIASIRVEFAGRIVEIDSDIAEASGRLRAAADAQGRPTDAIDALIAACAVARGAAVVTRNTAHFEPMGVAVVNPWTP
jgi:predicted nucleic acid-binding protein